MKPPLPMPPRTPEQADLLNRYTVLLREWNAKINLVAPGTLAHLQARHIDDSAQLVPYIPHRAKTLLDVGSGGGLPGLVLAILAPQYSYTLAERDQRKAAFLHTVAHQLALSHVTVHSDDVNLIKNQYDVITCRAFSALPNILQMTAPLLAPGGCWLLLKGKAFREELKACETSFHLTTEQWSSRVSPEGCVVRLTPA